MQALHCSFLLSSRSSEKASYGVREGDIYNVKSASRLKGYFTRSLLDPALVKQIVLFGGEGVWIQRETWGGYVNGLN